MDWQRQEFLIPGGNTRSKQGRFTDISPTTTRKGQGAYIYCDDGRKYLDFVCGLGAILLGYGTREEVLQAVNQQLRRGAVYGLPSLLEGELAEQLLEYYPYYDMVRFGKNGVDSTTAAVRLARAITGKNKIAHYGYHGCADWYECKSDNRRGIPPLNHENLHEFKFNDIKSLETILTKYPDIGTVIIEQPP